MPEDISDLGLMLMALDFKSISTNFLERWEYSSNFPRSQWPPERVRVTVIGELPGPAYQVYQNRTLVRTTHNCDTALRAVIKVMERIENEHKKHTNEKA